MEKFHFKKYYGQNFLHDENILQKIVFTSNVDKDTLVIEIGPGSGNLSKRIIPLSGYSILYEIDEELSSILDNRLSMFKNYKIIYGDFLKQDICKDISSFNYKKIYVIANLPYYITTPIVSKLVDEIFPDKIIIMVQDEVANRLSGVVNTKDYGMISVLLSSKYNIKKEFKVSRNCFYPVPNVDSAIISMNKHNKYKIEDNSFFKQIVSDSFKFKRKTLRNNLKSYNLDNIQKILQKNGYSLENRAENIPVDVFVDLSNNI